MDRAGLISKLGERAQNILNELVPLSQLPLNCQTDENDEIRDLGYYLIHGIKKDKSFPCQDLLKQAILSDEKNQCIDPLKLDELAPALAPLMEVEEMMDVFLVDRLASLSSLNGNQIKDLLIPGCRKENKKLIPINGVSCASFTMCDESLYPNMENNTYDGPKGGCYSSERAKGEMRLRVFNGVRNNGALGLSVCSAFMETANPKTNYCLNDVPGVQNGYHAMVISGYRCQGGKMEYEVINSWGTRCPKSSSDPASGVECELDASGNTTGMFWVTEDVLVENTTAVTQITSQSKISKKK
jgi:hypothetical protein